MSQSERKTKISSTHKLPIVQQCQLLSVNRSSAYDQAKGPVDEELSLIKHIDSLHLLYPVYGARRLRDALLDEHDLVGNRKHARRLMILMDIHAVYPGNKGTSKPNKAHRIFPHLLRDIEVNRSNQTWCTDCSVSFYLWRSRLLFKSWLSSHCRRNHKSIFRTKLSRELVWPVIA